MRSTKKGENKFCNIQVCISTYLDIQRWVLFRHLPNIYLRRISKKDILQLLISSYFHKEQFADVHEPIIMQYQETDFKILVILTPGRTSKFRPPLWYKVEFLPSVESLDLLNKMRFILWTAALLEVCDVTNNGHHLVRHLGFYQELGSSVDKLYSYFRVTSSLC